MMMKKKEIRQIEQKLKRIEDSRMALITEARGILQELIDQFPSQNAALKGFLRMKSKTPVLDALDDGSKKPLKDGKIDDSTQIKTVINFVRMFLDKMKAL